MVKNQTATWETQVQSLDQEDPKEKQMATHSIILDWRIPWRRSMAGYGPLGGKGSDTTEQIVLSTL